MKLITDQYVFKEIKVFHKLPHERVSSFVSLHVHVLVSGCCELDFSAGQRSL